MSNPPRRRLLSNQEVADTPTMRVYRDFAEQDLKEKSYLPKEFILCNLPHKSPGDIRVWTRKNGDYTLNIEPGYDENGKSFGIPYGSIPRLLLCWITNEAIASKSRHIVLGNSLAQFLDDLGLSREGAGKRSGRRSLERQIHSLCQCRVKFIYKQGDAEKGRRQTDGVSVSNRSDFWWDYSNDNQGSIFESYILLSEEFYNAVMSSPVPLSTSALKALKKSPLAIDLYALASYRIFVMAAKGREVDTIPMPALLSACGSEYARTDNFRAALKTAMEQIKDKVWPTLNYEVNDRGLVLSSSPLTIGRKQKERNILPGQRKETELITGIKARKEMDDETLMKAKALAPKWDVRSLEKAFWQWVETTGAEVKDPRRMFLAFVRSHNKLNR